MSRKARRKPRTPRAEILEKRVLLSFGGGFTDGGIRGEYFPNMGLEGAPAFTRYDNRIDFEWGEAAAGGSNSAGFRDFPSEEFSVRWSGQIVPKFSETYTFITTADDIARLYIRPAGASDWTVLADHWETGEVTSHSAYSMTAGATYDIQLEYFEETGDATAKLYWSGPSTPLEVIEPLGIAGVNLHEGWTTLYADAMKAGRDEWGQVVDFLGTPKVARDANGWPLADAVNIVWEGRDPASVMGTYALEFKGKADVSVQFRPATFTVDGVDYTSLPSGVGYDPATNMTRAQYRPGAGTDILILTFKNTQRTADSPINTGVTNVKLMRPISPGATTSFSPDILFDTNFTHTLRRFTTQRWLTANQNTAEVNWTDRRLPDYSKINITSHAVWEYEVMLANETGKDLYITLPINASTDYVANLANLIKYGSDGVNPYTSFTESPAYPALNSNLRVYVEASNEVWNWAFTQTGGAANAAAAAVAGNTPEGQIINFDGKFPGGDFRRWNALKTVYASNAFRSVFGDAEMGDRVRMLLEYQYDNMQDTAGEAISFIDKYFNNADGIAHVVDPHPVSYYLWGAGAAAYFDTTNPRGAQTAIKFLDAGVESPVLPANSAVVAPAGSGWTFTGNSGVYRNATRTPIIGSQTLGATTNSVASDVMSLGYKFTVGSEAVGVYDLGRWVVSGNNQSHTVRLIRASDKSTVASATISTSGATAGAFAYARLNVPIVLSANTTYYLVSSEANGKDAYYDAATTSLTAAAGITIDAAVVASGAANQTSNPAAWTYTEGPAGAGFGPVGLRFAPMVGNLSAPPDAPEGSQALFIGDTGSITQTINFTKTGVYALEMLAASKLNNSNAIRIYIDGVEITPNGNRTTISGAAWTPGNNVWGRDARVYSTYGSVPFTIDTTGNHTLRIVGTFSAGKYTYLDSIRINSVDELFAASVPSTGYPKSLNNYARYAEAYGLNVVAYEGGWAVGGDDSQHPIQTYAAYQDSRAKDSTISSIDSFARAGGALYMFGTYYHWAQEDTHNADNYPLLQGIDARNDTLPVDPTNGTVVPAAMIPANNTWGRDNSVGTLGKNAWIDWNIIVPVAGNYDIGLITTAGGTVRLSIDDVRTVLEGTSGGQRSGSTFLSRGLHTIKVKSLSGTFSVTSVAIASPGTPFAPSGAGMSQLGTLTWLDNSSNETGFEIQRSTSSDFTSDLVLFPVTANVTSYADLTGDFSTLYYYRVRAIIGETPSAWSNSTVLSPAREAENPFRDKPGLAYTYHEGAWTTVPNFDALAPKKTGTITDFNLSIRDREDQFGVQYTGWINIPTDGLYTFYTSSDDGSKLWIGSTLIVNNDGTHGFQERSGQIRLRAGRHAIKVGYFEQINGQSLIVSYAGPGIAKTAIPASALSSGGVVNNQPPTIQVAPSAEESPVITTSTKLRVLGADDGGESDLFYTWRIVDKPAGANPVLGVNGANESKNIDVTFDMAGAYRFEVVVSDLMFEMVASVEVVVLQTLSTLTVEPPSAAIASGSVQAFGTTASDQFGHPMSVAPTVFWNVITGAGSIDSTGLYTAPFEAGSATIAASSGDVTGAADVLISNDAPTVVTAATASPVNVTGVTTDLSVLGADTDGGGDANLIYTWATIGTSSADVLFSTNGTGTAKNTTVTFSRAGSYQFIVTITDAGGLSTSSLVDVMVNQTATGILVLPSTNPTVAAGTTAQFTASVSDQFGQPMSAPISWSVTGAGNTISGSGLFTGGATAGSFSVTATSGSASANVGITVSTGSIFTGESDIGSTKFAGSNSVFNHIYTVKGGGADVYGSTDAFHFVHVPFTGDGEIVARVTGVQNTDPYAKAGVMFRESLAANARNAFMFITPAQGAFAQTRFTTGAATAHYQKTGVFAPQWVKVSRVGNVFRTFYSADGSNWTQHGPANTIAMAQTVYVGLAVTAHNNNGLNTSTFANVSITPARPGTPDLLASSDTGTSNTDNLTRNNRATGALSFSVPNTLAGATVRLYADGVLVGSAVATSNKTIISLDSSSTFSDGSHSFTARQIIGSNAESGDSLALPITIDSAAPIASIDSVSPNPRVTSVASISIAFDGAVVGFDRGDLSLTLNGGANLLTPSQTLSTIDGRTFTLGGLDSITSSAGNYVLQMIAGSSGIVDAAGNVISVDALTSWSVNPAVSASAGGPYSVVEGGSVVLDATASTGVDLTYAWDFDYDGVTFNPDATGATPTLSGIGLDGPASRTVAVRVTDSAGIAAIATASLTIENVNPALSVTGADIAVEGSTYSLNLSAGDPGIDSVLSWTVDWGDGTVDVISGDATAASHVYADGPGTVVINVTATDEDGSYDALPGGKSVSITNASPTATFAAGPTIVVGSASSVSFTTSADASAIDAAAGFVYSFDFNNDGDFIDPGDVIDSTSSSASFTYPAAGSHSVRGRITDKDGGFTDYTTNVSVAPAVVTLGASADTYVRDGASATTSFGGSNIMEVKKDAVGFNREGYITFDLSTITSIASAKIRLFGKLSGTMAGGLNAGLYAVADTTWAESTMNFGSRPAVGAFLTQVNVGSATGQYYEFDVTTYLQQQQAAGKTKVSFALRALNSGSQLIQFNTKEASTNKPQLVVNQV